jgi:UDP-N-acetylglucosamine pyrophosphorylase
MRFEPGFVQGLRDDLKQVRSDYRDRVERLGGLTGEELVKLVSAPREDQVAFPDHPTHRDLDTYLNAEVHRSVGVDAIKNGEVGYIILAGGAGTRIGGPKALMQLPGLGLSLLAQKVMSANVEGHALPLYIMTSPGMLTDIGRTLSSLSPLPQGIAFEQFESYRLTPDNRLAFLKPNVPDLYPTGHGDVGMAIRTSGALAENPNIKHFIIVNVDNVCGTPDPIVLGHHIATNAPVTCEVVARNESDKAGGVLAWVDNMLQVVEAFRLEPSFVEDSTYTNTNTMIIRRDVLEADITWKWHRVRKQVGTRLVIQHERLLQQYTALHSTRYVVVPREQRYFPIKDEAALQEAGKLFNGNPMKSVVKCEP